MSNTLNNLIPDAYRALDVVSRELTGFIPSVSRNSTLEIMGKGDIARIPITQAQAARDITPGQNSPTTGDQTIDNATITISKARAVDIKWEGEQQKSYARNGTLTTTLQQQFEQGFRTLANEVEADLAAEYIKSSRAYGTAGTTPFASSLQDAAQIKKILDDNGAPGTGRNLIIDTTAGVNLRSLTQLNQANTAGTDQTLRNGVLLPIFNMDIRESAQINSHTKGAGTGYLVNNVAGYAVGDTEIAVDTGTGTILAGDVITFIGDTNKYIVKTGIAAPGTVTIAGPGLRQALADNTAVTVGGTYVANLAYSQNAIQLVTRMPAVPEGGDSADDRETVIDPRTGIGFEIAIYRQYRQVKIEVGLAWGVSLIKPEHTAILLG